MASGILSPTHLLVVLVVALIVLGPKRLPHAGKALGQGLREFKDSVRGAVPDQMPMSLTSASALPGNEGLATPEPLAAVTSDGAAGERA